MFRFNTLTLLNSSEYDTLSRRLGPTLLICGVKNVSSVLYNSLKRQEPTRLFQSQSPSPLSTDINTISGYASAFKSILYFH